MLMNESTMNTTGNSTDDDIVSTTPSNEEHLHQQQQDVSVSMLSLNSTPSMQQPQPQIQIQILLPPQLQQRQPLGVSTDPPADIRSMPSESIIMTAEGIQQQQLRWNQLKQQTTGTACGVGGTSNSMVKDSGSVISNTGRISTGSYRSTSGNQSKDTTMNMNTKANTNTISPDERILPAGNTLAAARRNTTTTTTTTTIDNNDNDGLTGTVTHYATLEHVQSLSVCSELSTTFVPHSENIDDGDGDGDGIHRNDPSSTISTTTSYHNHHYTNRLSSQLPKTSPPPSYIYNMDHYDIDTEDDDDVYTTTSNANNNTSTNNNNRNTSVLREEPPISHIHSISSIPGENFHTNNYNTTTIDSNLFTSHDNKPIYNNNHKNRNRSIWIVVLIVVVATSIAVVGVVCGTGNCNSSSNSRSNSMIDSGNDATIAGNGNDADSNEIRVAIESYLQNVSLTAEYNSPNNNDVLRQADTMAIEWIVEQHESSSINTSDPMVQQQLEHQLAIVSLYYSSNGSSWDNSTNWLEPQVHECDWYGIECDRDEDDDDDDDEKTDMEDIQQNDGVENGSDGSIDANKLSDNFISDSKESLFDEFNNSSNTSSPMTTTVPPTLSPSTILLTTVRRITSIDLSSNNVVGLITPNIGILSRLTNIDLSNNMLIGEIPKALSYCTNLKNFGVNQNRISGTIPMEIIAPWSDSIRRFDLGSNAFSGTIPSGIGLWTNVKTFAIDNNQFTGSIPVTIENWNKLEMAEFNSNQLIGTIPEDLCYDEYGSRAEIIVDGDNVVCSCCVDAVMTNIPTTVVPPINTPVATMPTINIPDKVAPTTKTPAISPPSVEPYPQITTPLAIPMFPSVSIPTSTPIRQPTSAPVVVSSPLTIVPTGAPMASSFANIRSYIEFVAPSGGGTDPNSPTMTAEQQAIEWLEGKAVDLQLNQNDPSGQFRIRQLYAVSTLYFSTNVPIWIITWESGGVNECNLSGITCSSVMDPTAGEQLAVTTINLSRNFLRGQLPSDLALLPYLEYVYFSGNFLSGTIPDVFITSTTSMKEFYFRNNEITGTLSNSLGTSWSSMKRFDVGGNSLSGTIPESISLWSTTTEISLSCNDFTGTVPSALGTFSNFVYVNDDVTCFL